MNIEMESLEKQFKDVTGRLLKASHDELNELALRTVELG